MDKINIALYEVTPAPYGDDYRFIQAFECVADGIIVLKALESVNIDFNCYRLIAWINTEKELVYDSWRKHE